MDPYLLKRLLRRPGLTLCSLIISIVLCLLTGFLFDYRDEQQGKLDEAEKSYDILCVVTDQRGTKSTSLRMESDVLNFVLSNDSVLAPYIRDLRITKEFKYSAPDYGVAPMNGTDFTPLIGITNERCADILNPALGVEVTYYIDDFYERTDYVCIVSEGLYLALEDDTIQLNVTDPIINPKEEPILGKGTVEFQVVGYYAGRGADIYIPFGAAMNLAQEVSLRISCDSIAFLASDNQNLAAISQAAMEKFGVVDPLAISQEGLALTIQDEQYRATVATLEQNIQRISYLVPAILLLCLGVGFLASFLSTRNEGKTYALMRTLGMNGKKLFWSILREQMVLAVVAAVIVLAISGAWIPIVVYLACYLIGCVACIAKTINVAPTAILREQE